MLKLDFVSYPAREEGLVKHTITDKLLDKIYEFKNILRKKLHKKYNICIKNDSQISRYKIN